ncbi:MAG: metallophosphoesterase [Clostridia bacterium]|nr:metallophosphoesterase [Clostridia bacterium]
MKRIVSLLLAAVLLLSCVCIAGADYDFQGPKWEKHRRLSFDETGKLRILQLADVQDGAWLPSIAKLLLFETVRKTKPDLIVLTGDNIDTYSCDNRRQAIFGLRQVMDILNCFNIPIAAVFGNHDDDPECGLSKLEQMDIYESYPNFIGYRGVVAEKTVDKTVMNVGTYNLPVYASKCSDEVAFNIWCFDSGDRNPDDSYGGYGYVFPEQLEWYKAQSDALKAANGGEPVPSIVFQHIIPPQIAEALQEVPEGTPDAVKFSGKWYTLPEGTDLTKNHLHEAPCPPVTWFRPGYAEVEAMLAQGDVTAIFCGHDHINAYSVPYKGIDLVCSPGITYDSYNDENRGVRLITIDKSDPTAHESELLLASDILHSRPLLSFIATIFEKIDPV